MASDGENFRLSLVRTKVDWRMEGINVSQGGVVSSGFPAAVMPAHDASTYPGFTLLGLCFVSTSTP